MPRTRTASPPRPLQSSTGSFDRIAAGRGAELAELFTRDGVLDAPVPNWRFTVRSAAAVAAEFARW